MKAIQGVHLHSLNWDTFRQQLDFKWQNGIQVPTNTEKQFLPWQHWTSGRQLWRWPVVFKQIHTPNPVNSIPFYISYRAVNSTALKCVSSFYLQHVYLGYNVNLSTGFYLICLLASSNLPFDIFAIKKSGALASCGPVEIYFFAIQSNLRIF